MSVFDQMELIETPALAEIRGRAPYFIGAMRIWIECKSCKKVATKRCVGDLGVMALYEAFQHQAGCDRPEVVILERKWRLRGWFWADYKSDWYRSDAA